MSIFAELQRRKVLRVAAAYAVVAWLLIQVAATVFPQLRLPEWAPTLVTVLLMLGFPVALVLAWAFELTPEGIRRANGAEVSTGPVSGRWLDLALFTGLVALAVVSLMNRRSADPVPDSERVATPPATVSAGASVAVLPFADMSEAGDQAWFGDGVAEQLLDELARLKGLRVAGRTSSFAYKGSQQPLQAIGAALNVATILEGSVRHDGERIRVTAQLINVADGYHLWSETWERAAGDIFSIQDEIAKSVAGELGVRLGVGDVNTFTGAGTTRVDAYEAYLKCSQHNYIGQLDTAMRWCDRALELDPEYAAAWSMKGLATASTMWTVLPAQAPALRDEAFDYVRRAVELDDSSALSWSLYGTILYARTEWIAGHEAQERAIVLWPNRFNLNQFASQLYRSGRLADAQVQFAESEAVEPLGGQPAFLHLDATVAQGRYADARRMASWWPDEVRPLVEWIIPLNENSSPEALRTALALVAAAPRQDPRAAALLGGVLEAYDDRVAVLDFLRDRFDDPSFDWPWKRHDIALLAARFGDPELALAATEVEVRGTIVRLGIVWYPVMADMRRLPGFKQLVRELNLLDYWRADGWADQCRPLGEDDFSCG